jgi:hypothetical protein
MEEHGSPKVQRSAWDSARKELCVDMKRIQILSACMALLFQPGPAAAGPPFRTDDPEPFELHQWEINLISAGTWTRDANSAAQPGFDANYGVAPGLQPLGHVAVRLRKQSGWTNWDR